MKRTVGQVLLSLTLCACLNAYDSIPADTTPPTDDGESLPILAAPPVLFSTIAAQTAALHRAQMLAGCKVAPVPDIDDPEALTFERDAESAPVDLGGLMPSMARALESFKELVNSLGGTFDLKSAYRPPAYQAHLQAVWLKWVKELRNNHTVGCRALREEVGAEFKRHQLLPGQEPVTSSDHTLGLAFDAAVAMPRSARLNRRRVSVDRLAVLSGITRPNSRRDPVHFKLLPEHSGF
jgi:hypothetical protein